MNTALLASVLALGLNPEMPVRVIGATVPLATPVPVAGMPYLPARVALAADPAVGSDSPLLSAVMALGRSTAHAVPVVVTARSQVPLMPGIVGPLLERSLSTGAPETQSARPQVIDLRRVEG